MRFISFLILLSACTFMERQVAEDVVQGEIQTIEKVAEDVSGNSPKPKVDIVKKKF